MRRLQPGDTAPRHRKAPPSRTGRHRGAGSGPSSALLPTAGGSPEPRTCAVVALVPAHNEETCVAAAVESLRAQTRRPDRIIVVTDDCTDETARVAVDHGAEAWSTVANTRRKAGALNQALALLLPTLDDSAFVLVSDADSVLDPGFVAEGLRQLEDADVGAVGGVFHGRSGGGLLGALQRMEYARYARELGRTDNVWVLTGTATLHRAGVLRLVAGARGGGLPGTRGDVYDRGALTEDMEITLAVKALGYRVVSPAACKVVTEVMPTWSDLFRQRVRWQRGAIANLRAYGASRLTAPYLLQQGVIAVGMLAMGLYLSYAAWWLGSYGFQVSTFWMAVGLVFVAERVVTVWRMGWRYRAVAALMAAECVYDLFLQAVMVRAVLDSVLRRPEVWHHATVGGR